MSAPTSLPGRLVTAMATPFHDDGSLDLDGVQTLASHLVDHGTETVLVHGTTGESPTLRVEEAYEVLAAAKEAVGDRATLMFGSGSNATEHAMKMSARATEAGADSLLLVAPYYNRPSQRMLVQHFTAIAGATHLPVVLYDVPSRTACPIDVATTVTLSAVDNIVGIKDASGDVSKGTRLVRETPPDFKVWCGADEVNLPYLAIGAYGFVSVASHLVGDELSEMIRIFEHDPAKAREIHLRLVPLYGALFAEPSPAPLKGAMNRLGLPAGALRPPLYAALDATVDAVLDAVAVATTS